MKLKNMWKRFWTLDVHNHEGFTLVELIIVIAILAILSTGAIAGYSAYVESANKTADKAMIAEIENVLTMAYYNGDITQSGQVILGANGVVNAATMSEQLVNALKAAYGDNWDEALKLKYAGWPADSYTASSFAGNEAELIGVVDDLATSLGNVVANGNNIVGDNFTDFLKDYEINPTTDGKAVGNAAVLYVAQKTQDKAEDLEAAFATTFATSTVDNVVNDLFTNIGNSGVGSAASMAALFAIAEGYAQYSGQASTFHGKDHFANVTNLTTAQAALNSAFNSLDPEKLEEYLSSGQAMADAKGYISMMGTVHDNRDLVSDNLKANDCFTDGKVADMLNAYTEAYSVEEGQVGIFLVVKDGILTITATSDEQ